MENTEAVDVSDAPLLTAAEAWGEDLRLEQIALPRRNRLYKAIDLEGKRTLIEFGRACDVDTYAEETDTRLVIAFTPHHDDCGEASVVFVANKKTARDLRRIADYIDKELK